MQFLLSLTFGLLHAKLWLSTLSNKRLLMETVQFESYEIKKLSSQDMADYFEKAFANPKVQHMIKSSKNLSAAESNFQHFGNMLQAYVSATGDTSEKMIETLAADFEKHSDKLSQPVNRDKIDGTQTYFADHVLPHIIKYHRPDYDGQTPLTLEETSDILKRIKLNCQNNRFKTHSFNGALLEEIKTNGLDINKEMFLEEYTKLREEGMYQPYQTGNLLFCELSKATFGYALCAPERLVRTICPMEKQNDDQPTGEYLAEGLEQRLAKKNLSPEKHKSVEEAGHKMIDFYFGKDNHSAIAFMEDTNGINTETTGHNSGLKRMFMDYFFKSKVEKFCQSQNNQELCEQFLKALNNAKTKAEFAQMDQCIKEFNQLYPNNGLFEQPIKNAFIKAVTNDCLNNFMYNGNADGYRIESGKLGTDKFSVATIPNPVEMYTTNRKQEYAIEKEKFTAEEYNRELYENKHALAVKSGRTPDESFEDYCAQNTSNIYFLSGKGENAVKIENPKYTKWKKDKGYDDPKSEASIALKQKIDRKKGREAPIPMRSIDSFELV